MRVRIAPHVRRNAVGYLALMAAVASAHPAVTHFALADTSSDSTTTSTMSTTSTTSTTSPGNIAARGRGTAPVVAKHGGFTDIPLTGATWTQAGDELQLVAGTMQITLPAACTGSFGNALVLSVDGNAATFASAPTSPASGTLSLPFVVGTLSEPGQSAQHKLSARFGNSCTKNGEDYTIKDVKIDVLKFH